MCGACAFVSVCLCVGGWVLGNSNCPPKSQVAVKFLDVLGLSLCLRISVTSSILGNTDQNVS